MSILTKEERKYLKWQADIGSDFCTERMIDALDTIDALEARVDALEAEDEAFDQPLFVRPGADVFG